MVPAGSLPIVVLGMCTVSALVVGCQCGPYPADAVGFRWEKVAERERELECDVSIRDESGRELKDPMFRIDNRSGALQCSLSLTLRRQVGREVDWRLTESRESFEHGRGSDAEYFYTDSPSGEASGLTASGMPSAEAMAAKPSVKLVDDDASATFRSRPVRLSWKVALDSGRVLAEGSRQITQDRGSVRESFELRGADLDRIADAGSAEPVWTTISVEPVGPASAMQPRAIRVNGPSPDFIVKNLGPALPPRYRLTGQVAAPGRFDDEPIVWRVSSSVDNRGEAVRRAPCTVRWHFGPEYEVSGPIPDGARLEDGYVTGEFKADAARPFEVVLSRADKERILRRYPISSETKGLLMRLVAVVELDGTKAASHSFRSEAVPRKDIRLSPRSEPGDPSDGRIRDEPGT